MKADIVTIFPDFFRGPLDYGITRRAQEMGLAAIQVHDLRKFAHDRHRTVDDRPFGGGEGMVLKPEPLFEFLDSMGLASREERLAGRVKESVVLLSAQGQRFSQKVATELALLDRIVFVCGRYEGVDERVADFLADREISIGDYVLSGGEMAAAVIVEAVMRLLPGAVGNEASTQQESFTVDAKVKSPGGAEFRGIAVPEALMSGNHEDIRRWRRQRALEKTLRNRPDLLEGAALSDEDKKFLAAVKRHGIK
jgi:tRNA (guanine37-N1)-methyltransferase